MAPRSV